MIPEMPYINLSEYSIAEEREPKSGFYDRMVELHRAKMNSFFLGRTETNVQFVMWVKRKVEKPADLAGLKGAGAPWMLLWYKALGISSVVIPTAERYNALQQGIIDVALVPLDTGLTVKFHEVTSYVIDHGVWPAGFLVTLINLDKWNGLSKKLQDIMVSVQKELEPEYGKWREGEQAKARQFLTGKVTFIKFSPAEAKYYVELAYSPRWDDAKAKLSPEDYAKLRKVLVKSR
jgi:TRAP-type C4-dicarboxylate transport system substrate-binding protein